MPLPSREGNEASVDTKDEAGADSKDEAIEESEDYVSEKVEEDASEKMRMSPMMKRMRLQMDSGMDTDTRRDTGVKDTRRDTGMV